MKDADLVKLIEGVGYIEGLAAVTDPGIINPREFIDQVIKARLPNPFMPDTPQRIAMDSSLKIPIRFGETIKAYRNTGKNCASLKFIPLVFAGWLRYLLGIDDQGSHFQVSPDPNYDTLAAALSGISLNAKDDQNNSELIHSRLEPILSNSLFFGINLYEAGLGKKVESFFAQMLDLGAVRKVISEVCS